MTRLHLLALLISGLVLASCAPPSQYRWGNYEHALYTYYKEPAELERYAEELTQIIATAGAEGRVPPGIYAEYGYVLWMQGKPNEAIAQFEREKHIWPESTHLMDLLIHNVTSSQRPASQSHLYLPHEGGSLL